MYRYAACMNIPGDGPAVVAATVIKLNTVADPVVVAAAVAVVTVVDNVGAGGGVHS